MTPACIDLLEPRGSGLKLLKSTLNAENFICRLSWYPAISSQFSVKMCAASKNCEKFTKNFFLRGSRSFRVIDVDKSKKPVTSTCYDKQHARTYLQPFSHYSSQWRQNDVFFRGYPTLTPSFEGTHVPSNTEILSRKLETLGQPTVKISWSYLAPFWYRSQAWQTDGQIDRRTDAQTMAKTREAFCFRA